MVKGLKLAFWELKLQDSAELRPKATGLLGEVGRLAEAKVGEGEFVLDAKEGHWFVVFFFDMFGCLWV